MASKTHKGLLALGVVLILLPILSAGCSPEIAERIVKVVETKDSLIIRDRVVHDTVGVEIPVIIERNVTPDDSSHLENAFAVSDAYVKDGLLHHSLSTKPQTIDVPVDIHVADTTNIHEKATKTDSTRTVIQYVEKNLSWSQKAKIGAFPWILLALIGAVLWIFRKYLF